MSLSDNIDAENGDLDWREYDAEATNAATLARFCPVCGEYRPDHDYACDGGFPDVTGGAGL